MHEKFRVCRYLLDLDAVRRLNFGFAHAVAQGRR